MSLAFHRFSIANLRYLCKNALTSSFFELEKCYFILNKSEFRQNSIVTIIRVLVRNIRAQSEIGNHEKDQRVSAQSEQSVPPPLRGSHDYIIVTLLPSSTLLAPFRATSFLSLGGGGDGLVGLGGGGELVWMVGNYLELTFAVKLAFFKTNQKEQSLVK